MPDGVRIERYPEHGVDPHLTEVEVAQHRDLPRWAVTKALDPCIENDGHLVCHNGTTQRLTFALAGYIEGILCPGVVSGAAIFNVEVEVFWAQLRREAEEAGIVLSPLPASEHFATVLATPEPTLAQFDEWMTHMQQVYQELTGRRQDDFLLATRAAAPVFAAWPEYVAAHPDFPGEG